MGKRHIIIGASISAIALLCLIYLIISLGEKVKDIETVLVTLIIFAAIPWLGIFVRDFQIGKEGVRATLIQQQKSINILKMIVMALLTDYELEILGNLIKETGIEYFLRLNRREILYESDKRNIIRLMGLGFLELSDPEKGLGYWENEYIRAPENNKPAILLYSNPGLVRPTKRGRNFYWLYERVHGPVDLKTLGERLYNTLR